MVAGLYNVGDSAELSVPTGPARRFDLIAYPKSALSGGSCSVKLLSSVNPSKDDLIVKTEAGENIALEDLVLFARGTSEIVAGDNQVTLTLQSTDAAGLPYNCINESSVLEVSSLAADASYGSGSEIDIEVEFSSAVTVTASPRILLNTSPTARYANFISVSGSTALFRYTVLAGDSSPLAGLNYVSMTALELNGGAILDSNGNAVNLTLPDPTGANSLNARNILIDTAAPALSVSSPVNAFATGSSLTITGTCEDTLNVGAVVTTAATGSASVVCAGSSFSLTIPLTIIGSDGDGIALAVSQTDLASNTTTVNLTGILDLSGPTGEAMTIEGGAPYTNTTSVTLNLTVAGATEMYITNTAGCASDGVWEGVNATRTWTLPTPNATNSVYAKFRDAAANESTCVSASILHDNVYPALTITAPTASFYSNANLSVSGTCESSETVTGTASGGGTGTNSVGCAAGVYSFVINMAGLGGEGSVINLSVSQTDAAGNTSTANRSGFLDTVPPSTTSIAINSGDAYTNSDPLTLNLAATDADYMYITNTAGCATGGAWEAFSTSKVWAVPSLNSTNTVYVKFKDAAGNASACISDSIVHDNQAPTLGIDTPLNVDNASVMSHLISGTCTEDGTVTVEVDDASNTTTPQNTSCTAGIWSINLNLSSMLNGSLTVTASMEDAAGNPSSIETVNFSKNLTLAVEPAYMLNGNGWGKYVQNDGTNLWDATDAPCDALGNGYNSCLHGGELFRVEIPGQTSCIGLNFTESGDYFEWTCDDSGPNAVFYTRRLKASKSLSDLINFAGLNWIPNSVSVMTTTPNDVINSDPMPWWSTPIIDAPTLSAGVQTIGTSDQVYVVRSNNTGAGWTVNAPRVSLVIQPGYRATLSSGGLDLVTWSTNFGWIEGAFDCDFLVGSDSAIYLPMSSKHVVLRNVRAERCNLAAIYVEGAPSNGNHFMKDIAVSQSYNGLQFFDSHYNTILNLTASNTDISGLFFSGSSFNSAQGVLAIGGVQDGIEVIDLSQNNFLTRITTANNVADGIWVKDSASATIHNALTLNNGYSGVTLEKGAGGTTTDITVGHLISAHNDGGVAMVSSGAGTASSKFTGILGVGSNTTANCTVSGTFPGLVTGTCSSAGTDGSNAYGSISNATLRLGANLANAFVGKLTIDDPVSSNDANGLASWGVLDGTGGAWTRLEGPFRAWGIEHANPIMATEHRGACLTGNCRIFDFSQVSSAAISWNRSMDGVNPNSAFIDNDSCPAEVNGFNTLTDASGSIVHLANAVEILGDWIGNENGLCESNEACMYTPHFGVYQGQMGPPQKCNFVDGTVSGVKMFGPSGL